MQRNTRVVDARETDEHAETDYGHVERNLIPFKPWPLQMQVKVAGPDEREGHARYWADEAHKNGKVRYEYGQEESEHNEKNAQTDGPDTQVSVQVVAGAHEHRLGVRVVTELFALCWMLTGQE